MFQDNLENQRDDSFLNEFRQKLANQSTNSIEEKHKDMQRSKSVFLGTIAGVGLACVVGWFILAPSENGLSSEVPVVRRPQTAIKIKPSEPGGMEIANQDKSVYDIIDKNAVDKPSVERLLPPPEQPVIPEIVPDSKDETISDVIANSTDKTIEVKEITQPEAIKEIPAKEDTISMADAMKKIEEKENEIKVEAIKVEEKPVPVIAPVVEPKIAKGVSVGSWQVQLISSKNKEGSEKSWPNLIKKHPDLSKETYEIEDAKMADGSIFYRLKAGAFKTKEEATSLCNKIKSQKGSCLVTQK